MKWLISMGFQGLQRVRGSHERWAPCICVIVVCIAFWLAFKSAFSDTFDMGIDESVSYLLEAEPWIFFDIAGLILLNVIAVYTLSNTSRMLRSEKNSNENSEQNIRRFRDNRIRLNSNVICALSVTLFGLLIVGKLVRGENIIYLAYLCLVFFLFSMKPFLLQLPNEEERQIQSFVDLPCFCTMLITLFLVGFWYRDQFSVRIEIIEAGTSQPSSYGHDATAGHVFMSALALFHVVLALVSLFIQKLKKLLNRTNPKTKDGELTAHMEH